MLLYFFFFFKKNFNIFSDCPHCSKTKVLIVLFYYNNLLYFEKNKTNPTNTYALLCVCFSSLLRRHDFKSCNALYSRNASHCKRTRVILLRNYIIYDHRWRGSKKRQRSIIKLRYKNVNCLCCAAKCTIYIVFHQTAEWKRVSILKIIIWVK